MKTPMQELLDGLNNTYYKSNDVIFRDSLHFVICIIEQNYIEKEKDVIMDAYDYGFSDAKSNHDHNKRILLRNL